MIRWLIFGAALLISTWILMIQPPQSSSTLFLMLIVGAVLVAAVSQVAKVFRPAPPALSAPSAQAKANIESDNEPVGAWNYKTFTRRFAWQTVHVWETLRQINWGRTSLMGGSLLMMYVGQAQIYRDPFDIPTSSGWIFILIGLGMFFVLLKGAVLPDNSLSAVVENAERPHVWIGWLATSIALGALTSWRTIVKPQEAYLSEHLVVWGLCMLTLIRAFSPADGRPRIPDSHPLRGWEWGLVLGILVLAILFRATNLEGNPPVLDQDEALFAEEGSTFLQDNFLITPFEPGIHSHPRMYQAMIGLSVTLYGPTLTGARMPSALMGALGVIALYLLGRELLGWQGGLIAALFMLPWFFHIQLSRLSMNQPGDPLFATLSFYFLLRGLRRRAPTDFVLSGILMGVAQMFYLGGRLAIPVMVAYIFFIWLRERDLIAKQWRSLLIVPLATFIVTLPQNYYLLYFQQPFSTRAEPNILLSGQLQSVIDTGGDVGAYLYNQVRSSFLALFQIADRSGWVGRGSNILGVFGAPMLLIGVIMSLLVIWKRPRWSLPLGWGFAVILLGSTLSISPPEYQRYFPAVSAFSLLIAIGTLTTALGISKIIQRPQMLVPFSLIIGLALFVCNLVFYYGVYVPGGQFSDNRLDWATNRTAQEMVAASKAGRQVILVGEYSSGVDNTLVVRYFMLGRKYIDYSNEGLETFDPNTAFAFIIGAGRETDLNTLVAKYPGGKIRAVYLTQDNSLAFYVYERG